MKNGWKFNIFKLYKVLNKCNVKFNYLFDFWLKQILCCHLTSSNTGLFVCSRISYLVSYETNFSQSARLAQLVEH